MIFILYNLLFYPIISSGVLNSWFEVITKPIVTFYVDQIIINSMCIFNFCEP